MSIHLSIIKLVLLYIQVVYKVRTIY